MHDYDNLQGFLEHVALATSIDQEWGDEKVNIMTMHAAKGLEFESVFLPGWEEGLFPHQKSLEEKGDLALEEERRLAYVGITRAQKKAYISFAMKRLWHGDWMDSLASRFINELPENGIEKNEEPVVYCVMDKIIPGVEIGKIKKEMLNDKKLLKEFVKIGVFSTLFLVLMISLFGCT